MHESNKHHAEAARDRKALTVITQKMMLHVWESYVEMSDLKVKTEVQRDDDEVYRMMLRAKFEEEDEEYDTYDPFGEIDTEGRDVATAPSGVMEKVETEPTDARVLVTNPEGENAELEKHLVKRFANYGWTTPGLEPDQDLRCSYPEGKGTKLFGEIRNSCEQGDKAWGEKEYWRCHG